MAIEADQRSNQQESEPQHLLSTVKNGEFVLIVINGFLLLVTIIIAVIYSGQLDQMRVATQQATRAAVAAEDASIMQDGDFERNMRQIANQTVSETTAAKAAQSAARTADRTLRISQAAYITTGTPDLNFSGGIVHMTIPNSGHIPSGKIHIVVHEASGPLDGPDTKPNTPVHLTDFDWQEFNARSVPQGEPFQLGVNVPQAVLD